MVSVWYGSRPIARCLRFAWADNTILMKRQVLLNSLLGIDRDASWMNQHPWPTFSFASWYLFQVRIILATHQLCVRFHDSCHETQWKLQLWQIHNGDMHSRSDCRSHILGSSLTLDQNVQAPGNSGLREFESQWQRSEKVECMYCSSRVENSLTCLAALLVACTLACSGFVLNHNQSLFQHIATRMGLSDVQYCTYAL